MASIPVANIYFLLCYAWDEFAPRSLSNVAAEPSSDTLDLFARILVNGVRLIHKRGLMTGYAEKEEVTSTIRGRVLFKPSISAQFRRHNTLVCSRDELTINILRNQILKTTLHHVSLEPSLTKKLRGEVRLALRLLSGIDTLVLSERHFQQANAPSNNRIYKFLINVCRFLFESLEASDIKGEYRFREVLQEPERMRRVFEKFVRNFFSLRQRTFTAKKRDIQWSATALGESTLKWLPSMQTDVTLQSPTKTIVIECEYTGELFQTRYASQKLRSSHLYQLCSYLRSLEFKSGPDASADGVLLYPSTGLAFDQSFILNGHRVRIKTLDLNRFWKDIEVDLLELISDS